MALLEACSALVKDFRYGFRQLRRAPGFAAVAVLTLALGIGANTAVFSVMNAVMLRYLPVEKPQQLVMLRYTDQPDGSSQSGHDQTSLPENVFETLRNQKAVFSDLMAFVPIVYPKVAVRFGSDPEEAGVDEVSGNFFTGLGVHIVRGRSFAREDESKHAQVAILSYDYWTRRFAQDGSILGQTIYVKGVPFTIVGISAPGFAGLEREKATDLWVPFQTNAELKPWGHSVQDKRTFYNSPDWFFLMMIGRLQPGVSPEGAQAQLDPIYKNTIHSALGQPKPGDRPSDISVTPTRGIEGLNENYKEPLLALMAMVGLVLLIACINVSLLMVARNAARQREFSVRLALGAGRGSLFRQLLAESLLLVLAGGLLAWGFALLATRALANWSLMEIALAPDRTVLVFALGISALAALLFGLAPLRSATAAPPGLALKTAAAASSQNRSRVRAGQWVLALQISLCLMLLAGAGLLVRTLRNLEQANLGMRTERLMVFGLRPPQAAHTDADVVHFFHTVLGRFRSLPEVESATLVSNRFGAGWSNNTAVFVDGVSPNGKKFSPLRWNVVGPEFLQVMGIPLLVGRDVSEADSSTAPRVAIINETFAKQYIKDGNPIGHRMQMHGELKDPPYTIVGVAADNKYTGVRERPRPMAYIPYTQVAGLGEMQIELRTRGDGNAVLADARRIVKEFGPDLPLQAPTTQQAEFEKSFSDDLLFARLAICFGLLAAMLVATGLYGTMAYRVSRRTAEIGVRMALGAQRTQVLWMVLRESLLLCAAGVVIGLPAAFACSRLLRSMLFNLSPNDPSSFLVALAGVCLVTLLATAVPARRASSVDPIIALRYE